MPPQYASGSLAGAPVGHYAYWSNFNGRTVGARRMDLPSAYTDSATVGCLVCLDDDSALEMGWRHSNGVMLVTEWNGEACHTRVQRSVVTGRPETATASTSEVYRGPDGCSGV
jgi:hypothetical protein